MKKQSSRKGSPLLKLRRTKEKKFYITTAIAYTNAAPHIGHALEAIQADAIARYKRQLGGDVFFLTGTDEHGDKINRIAVSSGRTAKAFVDEISAKFKGLKKNLGLSFDDFIRTTDKKRHYPGVYALFEKMKKKGDIYVKNYKGLYCIGCEKFLTEKDLTEEGNCPFHKKPPEVVEEQNFFFRLSRYGDKIREAIEKGRLKIYPEATKSETLAFIRDGLEDVSFSRSKKSVPWGIPIPDSDQTMYVWGDALTNYISAIGYGRDEKNFKKWWPADVHLIGKDIFRFHAVIWPAMLMSAGLPIPKSLFVHGFITVDGEKMSKTIGNVIDAYEPASRYGSDALRYYILREIPSDGDGDFSYDRFDERYESDLAKGLGNFAARTLNLLHGEKVNLKKIASAEVRKDIKRTEERIKKGFGEFRLHESLAAVFDLIKSGDVYVNERQPWKNKSEKISRDLTAYLQAIQEGITPFMPETAKKMEKALGLRSGIYHPKKISRLFPLER